MEDKTFELMTKLYSEFTNFRKDITQEVKKVQIKIDHDIEPKIQALYEDREVVHSKLDTLEVKVDSLIDKVESHDIEIKVIKGGKGKR